ncbi:MAG: hypothetical protein WD739_11115 [Actinomycetota bacterium]
MADGNYYLESSLIDRVTTSAAAHDEAKSLVALINGILLTRGTAYDPVTLGSVVIELDEDGTEKNHVVLGAAALRARSKLHAIAVTSGGMDMVPARPESARFLDLAMTDPDVNDALRLWGSHPHDWITLYKIFEIMGRPVFPDRARFTHTANHPAASGDASRHGRMNQQPPSKPMVLHEARAAIGSLLELWLRSKLPS